jgi:hypothetical protein
MSGLKKTIMSAAEEFSFRKRTRSQTGSSSRAYSDLDMSSVPRSSSVSQPEHHVLLQEHHIKLHTTYENDLMRLYKDHEFEHTLTFDPLLLTKKQVWILNSILFFAILDGIIIKVFWRMDVNYLL